MKLALTLVLTLVLSACVMSENPLAPVSPLAENDPLLGSWVLQDDRETIYLHIGNDARGLKLIQVEMNGRRAIKTESFHASSHRLADHDFLSIEMVIDTKKQYLICKYRIAGDRLTLWSPDKKYMAAAVADRSVAGSSKPDVVVPSVLLSAGPDELRQFVARHHQDMFAGAGIVMKRAP